MTKNQKNTDIIREAGRILKEGGLVAFPTETVYGLGADALNEEDIITILKTLKERMLK